MLILLGEYAANEFGAFREKPADAGCGCEGTAVLDCESCAYKTEAWRPLKRYTVTCGLETPMPPSGMPNFRIPTTRELIVSQPPTPA